MRTVILLECSVPPELDRAQALGAISGVLAQHGALGVHATAIGDITVSLAAAANVNSGFDNVDTIRALIFDKRRTPEVVTSHCRDGGLVENIFAGLPSLHDGTPVRAGGAA